MILLAIFAVVAALVVGIFAYACIPPHSPSWRRVVAFGFPLVLVAIVGTSTELTARPKPIEAEWRVVPKAELLAWTWIEGEAIYVWLLWPGNPEPRAYVLPWSQDTAEALQGATEKSAEGGGEGVEIEAPFGYSLEDRPGAIHPKPVPALPEKQK